MRHIAIFSLVFLGLVAITCKSTSNVVVPPKARQLNPDAVTVYHRPIEMRIAWVPYNNLALKQTKANNWVIVESDSAKAGAIPVIQVIYPVTADTVWVQMNTKNDLLGKLIKHSLMTQQPIYEPYSEYFEKASCGSCHPSDVKVSFD